MTLTNHERILALRRTSDQLDSIPALRGDPHARGYIRSVLNAEADRLRQGPPVHFHWHTPAVFQVDGVTVHNTTRGLPIAWFTLWLREYGDELLPANAWFQGVRPSGSLWQACQAAADAVRPASADLADVIEQIGVQRGAVMVKPGTATRPVRVTAGPWFSAMCVEAQQEWDRMTST